MIWEVFKPVVLLSMHCYYKMKVYAKPVSQLVLHEQQSAKDSLIFKTPLYYNDGQSDYLQVFRELVPQKPRCFKPFQSQVKKLKGIEASIAAFHLPSL